MGGHVAAELAIAFAAARRAAVLVSAAGITAEQVQRDAVMAGGARPGGADDAAAAARRAAFARRPRLRRVALSFVVRHPDRLSAPLALRADAAAPASRASCPRWRRCLDAPRSASGCRRSPARRCRVGRGRPRHPRRATRSRFARLIPDGASRSCPTPGTSRCSSARRASTRCWTSSSPSDPRAPRSRRPAEPAPDAAQRVTAPSAALPTSFAYFWIATSTCSSARGAGA